MKQIQQITKKDALALFACIVFLLLTLGAVGPGGSQRQRSALCLANLQQWSLAWSNFFADNDNRAIGEKNIWDMDPSSPLDQWDAEAWPDILRPYYRDNDKIRFCPQAKSEIREWWGDKYTAWHIPSNLTGGIEYAGSYGINDWVYDGPDSWGGNTTGRGWSSPDMPGAANAPLFLDCVHIGSIPINSSDSPPQVDAFPYYHQTMIGKYCMDRHGRGRINGLFLDGSARPIGLKELWKLKWHRQFNTNGPWTIAGGATPNQWPEWMKNFKDY